MKPRMGILQWSRHIGLTLAMMAGLGWGNAAPSHAQTKIVEGFVSHGALQWPEYIATELGWLKENGIELDMLVVGGGAAQQLAAGALNEATRKPFRIVEQHLQQMLRRDLRIAFA